MIPRDAKYCPYCGFRVAEDNFENALKRKRDKDELKKLFILLLEELGAGGLKNFLSLPEECSNSNGYTTLSHFLTSSSFNNPAFL